MITLRKSENGMTLIELLVVMLIMSILAAIAIPAMVRSHQSINENSAIAQVAIGTSVEIMGNYIDNGGANMENGGFNSPQIVKDGVDVKIVTTKYNHCVFAWGDGSEYNESKPYIVSKGKKSETCPL